VLVIELTISILFSLDMLVIIRNTMAISILILFTIFTSIRKKTGIKECSCFGKHSFLNKYPEIRNIIMILLILITSFKEKYLFDISQFLVSILLIVGLVMLLNLFHSNKYLRELKKNIKY
jgi:hypothetical protein